MGRFYLSGIVLTLIFLVARIILAVPAVAQQRPAVITLVVWLCNVAALLVSQRVINWPQLFPRGRIAVSSR